MAIVAAADFRERTIKNYCANLSLTETDGTDAYIDLVVAQVTARVEMELNDDFEPAGGDPDVTLELDGSGTRRQYLPRRCRSITTLKTRNQAGTLTTETAANYRLRSSLNAGGTAMQDGRLMDWVDIVPGLSLSTGCFLYGPQTVQIVGKFGWAVAPDEIKRLVALLTYDLVKPSAGDPLSTMVQLSTVDAVRTFGPSTEVADLMDRYRRPEVMVA